MESGRVYCYYALSIHTAVAGMLISTIYVYVEYFSAPNKR